MIVLVWRELIVACLMYCANIHLDKVRKSKEILRIAGNPARFISNTSVVYGYCTILLGTFATYSLLFMLCICRIIKIWKCGQSLALHINKSVIEFKICNLGNWETYFCFIRWRWCTRKYHHLSKFQGEGSPASPETSFPTRWISGSDQWDRLLPTIFSFRTSSARC